MLLENKINIEEHRYTIWLLSNLNARVKSSYMEKDAYNYSSRQLTSINFNDARGTNVSSDILNTGNNTAPIDQSQTSDSSVGMKPDVDTNVGANAM